MDDAKAAVRELLAEGVLLSPDIVSEGGAADVESLKKCVLHCSGPAIFSKDILNVLSSCPPSILSQLNWLEFERARVLCEKTDDARLYTPFLEALRNEGREQQLEQERASAAPEGMAPPPEVIVSYDTEGKSWTVRDFVSHFKVRFASLSGILRNRPELTNAMNLGRAQNAEGNISLIGAIKEKGETKNKNMMLTLEDPAGWLRVVVNKSKPEVYKIARDLVLDEVVGITGSKKGDIVFANDILLPEVPLAKELKKCQSDCLAAVISDIHTGSVNFLKDDFERFIKWIRGEFGNEEQRSLAKQVKYLFVLGDLVAGVGIYPGQEDELTIKSIREQFRKVAGYLSQVPQHIHIIIIPGNHDGIRLAEPQPPLDREIAAPLYSLPNALFLSNPSWVRLLKTESFPGFDFLLYHGSSLIYYADSVNSLRLAGGVERASELMSFLLRRRHLAPTHGSTLYVPDPKEDSLLITRVPDFFLCGHLHKSEAATYNNITLICGSCWESQTEFEKKLGLRPEPARVPLIDFRTREIKVLNFGSTGDPAH